LGEFQLNKNLLRAALALQLLLVAGIASAATVDRIVLNDGTALAFRNPQATVDSSGNVHIVAQGQPNDFSSGDDVYYFRRSSSGSAMTAQFAVTTGGIGAGRPQVVATSNGRAVVAWKENSDIVAVLIDPANGGSIVDGPDIVADNPGGGTAGHFSMAIAEDDDVHIIVYNDSGTYHARIAAANLAIEVPAHLIGTSYWRGVQSAVAVDSAGNVHVVFVPSSQAPSYTMLNAAGDTQIDDTLLNPDGVEGNYFAIAADDTDEVRIAYGDRRFTFSPTEDQGSEGGSMFQVAIDPTAHTGGVGAAGDIDELRLGDDLLIGNFWYGRAFVGSDGEFRAVAGSGGRGSGNLNFYRVSGNSVATGNVVANNQALQYYRKHGAGAGNLVIWSEGIYVPTLSGVSTQLVAARTSAFDSATKRKGNSGSPAPLLLLVLAMAALTRFGFRRA
jgi:hypothetical protein